MAYQVKDGDTIYDASFNISGSLAAVDPLLDYNTSTEYPMLGLDQLKVAVDLENATYYATEGVSGSLTQFWSIIIWGIAMTNGEVQTIYNGYSEDDTMFNIKILADGTIQVQVASETGSEVGYFPSNGAPRGFFVALSIDPTNGPRGYLNGSRIFTGSDDNGLPISDQIVLGSLNPTNTTENFTGSIYGVRLFNYDLSDSDVLTMFNGGKPGRYVLPENLSSFPIYDYNSNFSQTQDWSASTNATVTYAGGILTASKTNPSGAFYQITKGTGVFPVNQYYYRMIVRFADVIPEGTVIRVFINSATYYRDIIVTTPGRVFASPVVLTTSPTNNFYLRIQSATLNTVDISSIQVLTVGSVMEFIPSNAYLNGWADSSGYTDIKLSVAGTPILESSYEVPITNQFETYSPYLQSGQILITTDSEGNEVPVQNLESVSQLIPFNSTYFPTEIVEDAIAGLRLILDNVR